MHRLLPHLRDLKPHLSRAVLFKAKRIRVASVVTIRLASNRSSALDMAQPPFTRDTAVQKVSFLPRTLRCSDEPL